MSKRVTTNFKEVNLEHYLYSALPIRFQGVDPAEFEDFIAYLFRENGYEQVQTSYSADFGADLIVKKEGVKTAVQVKRYFELHKVGITDINQIIGAQQYYRCEQALMITTSSYTPEARNLAKDAGVILWDWHRLEKAISDTFMDGKSHAEYYKAYPVDLKATDSDQFRMQIQEIELPDRDSGKPGRISIRLTNLSEQHQKISCDLPIILTEKQFQFSAVKFVDESFSSGIVYGNATVELICEFSARQFTGYDRKDRLLLPIHLLQTQEYIVLEQRLGQLKNECFLVTFYYGQHTAEYRSMVDFRDQTLSRTPVGRACIRMYYRIGSVLVELLHDKPLIASLLKPFVSCLVWSLCIRNSHRKQPLDTRQ